LTHMQFYVGDRFTHMQFYVGNRLTHMQFYVCNCTRKKSYQ